MSETKARNRLHNLAQSGGNWRFKGLMLAALPNTHIRPEEVAQAWPGQNKSDYRFLSGTSRDIETEMKRTAVSERGSDRHRELRDFALNADTSKTLSASGHIEESGDKIEARLDDAIPRMLYAAASPEEVDTLFREQLLETIQEGRQLRKVARDASNVIPATTRQGDVPIADDRQIADKVAEGSEIRDDREDYATVAWNCERIAKGSRVTDSMVDQAQVDIIRRNVEYTGAAVENGINRAWLRELVDSANGNHDTTGSDQGYLALNQAVDVVDQEAFAPDAFASTPGFRTALAADSNLSFANRAGTQEVLTDRDEAGLFDRIAGLQLHAATDTQTYDDPNDDAVGWGSTANTWGYQSDGELGAVVYDTSHIHTVIYSPGGSDVEVKDYEDPIRDLTGANARTFVDAEYSQERSAATIEF